MGKLAEVVGVVAIIRVESVVQGVAFGLKHDASAAVFVQDLNEGGGTGVGREEEHLERRFLFFTLTSINRRRRCRDSRPFRDSELPDYPSKKAKIMCKSLAIWYNLHLFLPQKETDKHFKL